MKANVRLLSWIKNNLNLPRQEAIDSIISGDVLVNYKKELLSYRLKQDDYVTYKGSIIENKEKFVYYAFHKPIGIVCTNDLNVTNNISSFLNFKERIYPIGRLDKNSCGLIFLTNDGKFTNKIINGTHEIEKEYYVVVDKIISKNFIQRMESGIEILNKITKKCSLKKIDNKSFYITITQGLNRQIRRMCKELGYTVSFLQRIRIHTINLDIKEGTYRTLSADEVEPLIKM